MSGRAFCALALAPRHKVRPTSTAIRRDLRPFKGYFMVVPFITSSKQTNFRHRGDQGLTNKLRRYISRGGLRRKALTQSINNDAKRRCQHLQETSQISSQN